MTAKRDHPAPRGHPQILADLDDDRGVADLCVAVLGEPRQLAGDLHRTNRAGAPDLRSTWKVAVAAGAAVGAGYLLRDSAVVGACVATVAFLLVAIVTRAVPADLYHALGFRWGEEDEGEAP